MLFACCRLYGVTIVIDQTLRLPPKIVGGRRLDVMRWGKKEINDNGYEKSERRESDKKRTEKHRKNGLVWLKQNAIIMRCLACKRVRAMTKSKKHTASLPKNIIRI